MFCLASLGVMLLTSLLPVVLRNEVIVFVALGRPGNVLARLSLTYCNESANVPGCFLSANVHGSHGKALRGELRVLSHLNVRTVLFGSSERKIRHS